MKYGDGFEIPGSGRMLEKRNICLFLLSPKFLLSGPILLQRVADVSSASCALQFHLVFQLHLHPLTLDQLSVFLAISP